MEDKQAQALYSMRDFCDITGLSEYTVRYYDKCGFFPNLQRNEAKTRKFSDADVAQLHLVESLRASGLSIEGIQYYLRLKSNQVVTAKERAAILQDQLTMLDFKYSQISEQLKVLSEELDDCRIDATKTESE